MPLQAEFILGSLHDFGVRFIGLLTLRYFPVLTVAHFLAGAGEGGEGVGVGALFGIQFGGARAGAEAAAGELPLGTHRPDAFFV
jgi:hypothetical protein